MVEEGAPVSHATHWLPKMCSLYRGTRHTALLSSQASGHALFAGAALRKTSCRALVLFVETGFSAAPGLFFFCREHRTSAAFRPGLATGAAEASPWSASRTLSEERACGSTSTLGLARRSAQGVARQIMMAFSVAFQGCTWQGRYSGGHPGNMPGQIPEYSRSNEVQYQVTSEYIFYKIHPWRL